MMRAVMKQFVFRVSISFCKDVGFFPFSFSVIEIMRGSVSTTNSERCFAPCFALYRSQPFWFALLAVGYALILLAVGYALILPAVGYALSVLFIMAPDRRCSSHARSSYSCCFISLLVTTGSLALALSLILSRDTLW